MSDRHTLTYPVYSGLLDVGTRFMYQGRLMNYRGNNVYREVDRVPPTPYQPKHARTKGYEPIPGNGPGTIYWCVHPCAGTLTGWYQVHRLGWSFWREDLNQ